MSLLLRALLLPLWLATAIAAHAETAVVEVYFLPLDEAETVVQGQLSPSGSVSAIASRRMLIIQDDAEHIDAATSLLRRLDARPVQYRATVEILQSRQQLSQGASLQGVLPGGWLRVALSAADNRSGERRSYNLRLQSGQAGFIEAGEIVPVTSRVRSWLAGFGFEQTTQLVPVTGGFELRVVPLADDQVRVELHPWLRSLQASGQQGRAEVQIDAGGGVRGRLDSRPQQRRASGRIAVASADTVVTVPLGSEVTIAGVDGDANMLGEALLAGQSSAGGSRLVMRLKVERLP